MTLMTQFIGHIVRGLVLTVIFLLGPGLASATTFEVAAGWDLFTTALPTNFPGLGDLKGVPLGTFDFDNLLGRGLGVQNVGLTDTIIERTTNAVAVPPAAGGTATIQQLLMNALQLETVAPVNLPVTGGGLDNYFITLQSVHGGMPSTGNMTITWDATGLGGTFVSSINVMFDIRKGSLTGDIVPGLSSSLTLTSTGTPWSDLAPLGALSPIRNVNLFLAGDSDPTQDFWPGTIVETHPSGAKHSAKSTPMPASLVLFCIGVMGAIYLQRRRLGS